MIIRLLVALMLFASSAWAATDEEQWCRDNPTICLCSEPLNTTGYTVEVSNWGWDPDDSTRKPCSYEGLGVFIDSQVGFSGSNNSTILNALPAGHSVSYVLKGPAGHTGQWFLGHNATGSDPTAHVAWRMYVYFSSDYQWHNGSCTNSGKLTQVGTVGMITTNGNGSYGLYSFGANGNFTPSNPDCCSKGPGYEAGSDSAINQDTLTGKWWRVEAHLIKRNATSGSPGLQFRMYMKDVSNNGTEYKVIDTSVACSTANCGPGTGWVSPDYTTNFAPPSTLTGMWFDYFRNGTCSGYAAASHYVAAAWSSDSGQRIGAASEIEGGGGGSSNGSNPTGGKGMSPRINLRRGS